MKLKWRLMCFYFIAVAGLFLYLKGFFPVVVSRVGFSSMNDVPPSPSDSETLLKLNSDDFQRPEGDLVVQASKTLPKNYTKLVLVVINALRQDFVYGAQHLHSMTFLHDLLEKGNAAGFVSKAQAPTITMPRVKALMTGNVPGYADVILSLDQAKELKEDSLIRSAFADGRSIVFYGDDTWTKLFPRKFKRQYGETSFFVNDYNGVDSEITKHVEKEMEFPNNFDIMISHYIGLGHIGHSVGARSPLVDEKLREMDSVIKNIYERLEKHDKEKNSKSLLVVTGDHGMTDKGSHGGTTPHERNIPLLFIHPGINKNGIVDQTSTEVQQTDLAVTLAMLLGLPIPRNSMGNLIMPMIHGMSTSDKLHALQYNAHHLLSLTSKTGTLEDGFEVINPLQLYRDGLISHATWLKHVDTADKKFDEAKNNYMFCQQALSDRLMHHVASYNHMAIGLGMVFTWLGYFAVVITWGQVVLLHKTVPKSGGTSPSSPLTWGVLATLGTIIHGISLLSSSFLEEEHQTWYFMTTTFLTIFFSSVTMDLIRNKFGMADDIQKGFFAKDTDKPTYVKRSQEESMELLRRGKSEDSGDNNWDFVELEPDAEEYTFDRSQKKLLQNSDLRTLSLLVLSLIAHRLLRAWNRTGIQYADLPDIGDWLNTSNNTTMLTLSHFTGLICIGFLIDVLTLGKDAWRRGFTCAGLIFIFWYRKAVAYALKYGTNTPEDHSVGLLPAMLTYFTIAVVMGRALYLKLYKKLSKPNIMDYGITAVILLSALLLRAHNIWALVFNLFLYWSTFRQLWPIVSEESKVSNSNMQIGKVVLRTTLCYWFGQMSYFSLGNSNSLATIDVSSGYVGISNHVGTLEDTAVRLLIIFSTYTGPLIWTMLCLVDAVRASSKESSKDYSSTILLAVFSTFAFLRLTPMAFYLILVTAMRYHLFVWSVFAPKLLYETASTVIYAITLLAATIAAKWIT